MDRRIVVAAGLMVVLATATGCASGRTTWTPRAVAVADASVTPSATDGAPPAAESAPPAATQPTVAPSEAPPSGEVAGTLDIVAIDLAFQPNALSVPAPGTYSVRLTNNGDIFHDIQFGDAVPIGADPGQTGDGSVVIPAGGIAFICTVPGHAAAGMTGTVTVEGPAASAAASAAPDDHGGPAPETEVLADPNAPPPVTFDATAPAALTGAVHDIDLVMTEQLMTVAPGFQQLVWTFGGTV
ncbi:MAG: hypothetical protein LH650_09765, partial [Chloroflexi bacterium]|nr:hypothetical protein [Chloroflexota bacterium]